MKMTVWMAVANIADTEQYLCEGNCNIGLDYHYSFPYTGRSLMDRYIFRDTRVEIMKDIQNYNKQDDSIFRVRQPKLKFKPVRVNVIYDREQKEANDE